MSVITDVPVSGVYIQRNAIFQLVAQVVDFVTGEPIQLQTATGLSISILYPDQVTSQTFPAQLLTDGSDGMISYITKAGDLFQVGLYHFQANCVINGVQQPASYEDDFYVQKNVVGVTPATVIVNAAAIILFSNDGIRWAGTVDVNGNITWAATPEGPPTFIQPTLLIMKDAQGVYWNVTISPVGIVTATPGGSFPNASDRLFLSDLNGKTWVVTITEAGVLEAA